MSTFLVEVSMLCGSVVPFNAPLFPTNNAARAIEEAFQMLSHHDGVDEAGKEKEKEPVCM